MMDMNPDDELIRDGEVLVEMELGAEWLCSKPLPDSKPATMTDELNTAIMQLPEVFRKDTLASYEAYKKIRDHFVDALSLMEEELKRLNDDRPALSPFPVSMYHRVGSRYRHGFARSKMQFTRRKNRLISRIGRAREKIFYLNKYIINAKDGLPPAPLPCSLCLESAIGTLVTEKERPKCSTVNCAYVICMACYNKVKTSCYPLDTRCPGCRGVFIKNGVNVMKHGAMIDPFVVFSDGETSDDDSLVNGEDDSEEEL